MKKILSILAAIVIGMNMTACNHTSKQYEANKAENTLVYGSNYESRQWF